MKSIIQNNKECFLCQRTTGLHDHHIFFGTANRKNSEKYGLKVWLCLRHHEGDIETNKEAVHHNKERDLCLKKIAQKKFEETHTREEFMKIFRRNYL